MEDVKQILVEKKMGKMKQIATTPLGEQLQERGGAYGCRCPGCSFISTNERRAGLYMKEQRTENTPYSVKKQENTEKSWPLLGAQEAKE